MKRITRPAQMYPVGVLLGPGFDTATEVALLALAGTGVSAGLPWYAVLVLPVLFGRDEPDGHRRRTVHDRGLRLGLRHPVRKIYYNLSITGLSVAVALVIGTIELISVRHDDLGLQDRLTNWVSAIDLDDAGFAIERSPQCHPRDACPDRLQVGFVGDALEVVSRGVRSLQRADLLVGQLDLQR
jgi:nickel/cobalt transporter (NiCoT) family protein